MSRAIITFLGCWAIVAGSAVAAQVRARRVCTQEEASRALDVSDSAKDWASFYALFKQFGHCDDGAIAEGYDDTAVRLLARDWKHFGEFVRLAESDSAFDKFVLRHIGATASDGDLRLVAKNAETSCPGGKSRLCEIVAAKATSAILAPNSGDNVVLGMLEEEPGQYSNDPGFRAVRVLFEKSGGEWKPFPSNCDNQDCLRALAAQYPPEVAWTIAFDGKSLGQIKTVAPTEFKAYAYMGLEKITSGETVPTVGKRSPDYVTYAGVEAYRPLVAVSAPNFVDPDVWKPSKLPPDVISRVRREFRKKFPKATNCKNPDENKQRPWLYRDEDISVVKAYSAQTRWSAMEVSLTGWRCDGPEEDGGPFDGRWYTIAPDGTIKFLDAGMWLVDAGDYDNDGKSELVFAIGGEDMAGYKIFYNDFKQLAVFKYIFH